ncbi:MAG: hypothetical protein QOG37_1346 [Mycobacterium sp.]|nr:hypothetical protein [Mycobacterium sp.]
MNAGNETPQQFGAGQMDATRLIDTAVGILVGWRRCSTQTAFRELLTASERHQVPLFAMAGALVNVASKHANSQATNPTAERAAEREWAEDLRPRDDLPLAPKVDRWL